MDIKKLMIRSASGLLYVAVIAGCCIGGLYGVSILAGLLASLATIEFSKITGKSSTENIPALVLDTIMAVCLSMGIYLTPLVVWICCLIGRLVIELYVEDENPLRNLARSLMTQVYIGVPMMLMVIIPFLFPPSNDSTSFPILGTNESITGSYAWGMILVIFFMIWINDTGAFLVGSTLGRHRLFQRISPKKSWEGFFGGLVFNLIAATLFCYFGGCIFLYKGQIGFWLGLAIVVTVFATWGDLVESMIKRNLHIKDSGNLIPGHGGILDRIDSLLLVAPAAFIYILIYFIFWYV